ncbi:MAG: N-acetylglucosamine-6-phosphate deacetylase [Paracoccaceae bacterium]
MNSGPTAYFGAEIFDGHKRHTNAALLVDKGRIVDIVSASSIPENFKQVSLKGGFLTAGFVDLQVNGGGGMMLNNAPCVDTIKTICDAHARFGTTSLLPTLITDTKPQTDTTIAAAVKAASLEISGSIGLHLEGPHLSVERKGAHDPAKIREMSEEDCNQLITLAAELPSLLLTVALESVTLQQIEKLSRAGAVVSLGHTNADYVAVRAAEQAGATCVTHLFNAMSQLENRAPGMVGGALEAPALFAGLIADGIHVDTATVRIAMRAKNGPGQIFLVTDAMATVGSDLTEFSLNNRKIYRQEGRLVLDDGTLAGADLDMISAVRFMINEIGTDVEEALRMASLYPSQLLGRTNEIGRLGSGTNADFVHLDNALDIKDVWRGGIKLSQ